MVGWLRGLLGVFLARTRLSKRLRAGFVLALLGVAAVSLAACGRAGPPELPPGPIFDSSYSPPGAARALAPFRRPRRPRRPRLRVRPKICARGNTKTLHKTALIRAAIRSRGRVRTSRSSSISCCNSCRRLPRIITGRIGHVCTALRPELRISERLGMAISWTRRTASHASD